MLPTGVNPPSQVEIQPPTPTSNPSYHTPLHSPLSPYSLNLSLLQLDSLKERCKLPRQSPSQNWIWCTRNEKKNPFMASWIEFLWFSASKLTPNVLKLPPKFLMFNLRSPWWTTTPSILPLQFSPESAAFSSPSRFPFLAVLPFSPAQKYADVGPYSNHRLVIH